jgi:GH25 family lysozyme M1 (1,4-beta-N-acetylmuramidase)
VDVSGHQTIEQTKAAAANPKYGFVIVKATEGQGFQSPDYAAQIAAVRDSGKLAGSYHFAWPNQDPIAEAQNFVTYASLRSGELACLDLENWDAKNPATMSGTPWTQRLDYAIAWLDEVKRLTGATPLVYVNWDWIKNLRAAAGVTSANGWASTPKWAALTAYPLWIAQYVSPGKFDTVSGEWRIVMHQWTNNDGGLDGDWISGPASAVWAAYGTA